MGDWKRTLSTVAAVLLAIGGTFGFREDAGGDLANAAEGIADHPIASAFVAVAIIIGVWTWRGELLRLLGLRHSKLLQAQLRGWLDGFGYFVQTAPATGGVTFMLHAELRHPDTQQVLHGATVVSLTADPDTVLLGQRPVFGDEVYERLEQMNPAERNTVLAAVKVEAASMGLGYSGLGHPLNDPENELGIHWDLYAPHLNRQEFKRGLQRLRHGTIVVAETLRRELQLAGPPTSADLLTAGQSDPETSED